MPRDLRFKSSRKLPRPGEKPPKIEIDKERFEVRIDGELRILSSLMFDIFVIICEADGRVISRQDLMKKLYGWPRRTISRIQTRTIDQHISRLRRSLSKRPLIQTVPRRGYKLIRY